MRDAGSSTHALMDAAGAELHRVLEALPVAAYTCDPDGLITYYNPQAVELWGREPGLRDTADRYCGSLRLFAADGSPMSHGDSWMARTLRQNLPHIGKEVIVERPDGRRATVLASVNPTRDAHGRVTGAVGILIDISSRKASEETRSLLAAIVESSDDAIISNTLDGHILSWNSGAERLFGYTAAEAIGKHISLIVPPEGREGQLALLARLCNGERIDHHETVRMTRDGRRVDVSLTISPVRNGRGELIGASKMLRDISVRRSEEQARALLAAIVESSDDAILSTSLDGRILSWNAGAERLFGYSAVEAIGKHVSLIVPPEGYEEQRAILARLRNGERVDHHETVRMARDGRRIDVSLTISPVYDARGNILGVSKVLRDITAQKRSSAALITLKDELATQLADLNRLHEMSTRLSRTLEIGPIVEETLRTAAAIADTPMAALALYDADNAVLQISASMGLDRAFLDRIEQSPDGGIYGRCLESGERIIVEDIEADPSFAPFVEAARQAGFRSLHCTPLVTRSGRTVGVLATHCDRPHRPSERQTHLTDLCLRQAVDFIENARLYAQLREADRRKDEFLATLAHELRSPLAPISNSLDLLKLSSDLNPAIESVREIMEGQVRHMSRLVDDLLEVSRIATGKLELRRQRIGLAAVIRNAVETSRPAIEAMEHTLSVSLPREPISVDVDPVRIAQVVANLLNNAAKYTDRGGSIRLSAWREGTEAVISVQDNGVGIPADMLPRVFDMFSQLGDTLTRSQGGLGIGLTLARRIVHLHGGRIEAYSDGPGQGSQFIVRLPGAVETAVVHRPAPSQEAFGEATATAHRILVVDDARASTYILGKLLERLGQEVYAANDGLTALELARKHRPHVVISDIGMPDMNGYELARRIRQEPTLQGVILVALTGYGQDTDQDQARSAGFDLHLTKPIGLAELRDLLRVLPTPAAASMAS